MTKKELKLKIGNHTVGGNKLYFVTSDKAIMNIWHI